MATEPRNQFTLTLPKLHPENISLSELAAFARDFEKAVQVEQDEGGAAEPGLPALSLVGVTDSSANYHIQANGSITGIVSRILRAIEHPKLYWEKLNPATRTALDKAFGRLAKLDEGVCVSGPLLGSGSATYTPLPLPEEPNKFVTGETELAVRVLGITSTERTSRAKVQSHDDGSTFECGVTSDDLLRRIGGSAKLDVILIGEAKWELPGWVVRGFTASDILPAPNRSVSEVFAELADRIGNDEVKTGYDQYRAEYEVEEAV